MSSIYHAYQAYEQRVTRGEFDEMPGDHRKIIKPFKVKFSYRLGDWLIRTGLKLKHQTQAGHALTTSTMAER